MVGTEILKVTDPDFQFIGLHSNVLNVKDAGQIKALLNAQKPDVVIHLAAKTNVDWCERNIAECQTINVQGTRHIAQAATEINALLVYPSTSYLYPGDKEQPYDERVDAIDPKKVIGVYAQSKFEGEIVVQNMTHLDFIIPRFGALYGGGKEDKKFVAKVLGLVKEGKKEIKMIRDRVIQPSSVKDTVANLLALIKRQGRGIYNMVGHGQASYYDYAQAILEFADITDVRVIPIQSQDFKESAPRPKNLTAINGRLQEAGLDLMRDWRIALKEYVLEIKDDFLNTTH